MISFHKLDKWISKWLTRIDQKFAHHDYDPRTTTEIREDELRELNVDTNSSDFKRYSNNKWSDYPNEPAVRVQQGAHVFTEYNINVPPRDSSIKYNATGYDSSNGSAVTLTTHEGVTFNVPTDKNNYEINCMDCLSTVTISTDYDIIICKMCRLRYYPFLQDGHLIYSIKEPIKKRVK